MSLLQSRLMALALTSEASVLKALAIPRAKPTSKGGNETSGLSKLRVRGQAYCRKCGIARCELHRHLQTWIGAGHEYCSVKKKFSVPAPENAKPFCYMRTPRQPYSCGRHRTRQPNFTPPMGNTPLVQGFEPSSPAPLSQGQKKREKSSRTPPTMAQRPMIQPELTLMWKMLLALPS